MRREAGQLEELNAELRIKCQQQQDSINDLSQWVPPLLSLHAVSATACTPLPKDACSSHAPTYIMHRDLQIALLLQIGLYTVQQQRR